MISQLSDSLSAKINQVQQISRVRRHDVFENYSTGSIPLDKESACLRKKDVFINFFFSTVNQKTSIKGKKIGFKSEFLV